MGMKKYKIICIVDHSYNFHLSNTDVKRRLLDFREKDNQDATIIESNGNINKVLNEYMNSRIGELPPEDSGDMYVIIYCNDVFKGLFRLWKEIKAKNKFKLIK